MSALIHTTTPYSGRHRPTDTQPIALTPAAPMYGRLSRPLRSVPTGDPTTAMPALRLLPPVQADRRTGWKLSRRGRRIAVVAVIVAAALLAAPVSHAFWSAVVAIGSLVGVA